MSKIHNVVLGDRITNLSIKYYGTAGKTGLIINANPQLKGRLISLENLPTIYPGDILIIPEETQNITNFPEKKLFPETIPVTNPNEISFLIEGKKFNYFTEYNLNKSLDSFDSISFSVPFDTTNNLIKLVFDPFAYKDIGIYYNGILQFGGTMIGVSSESNPNSKIINVACYPKCGVLNDCSTPVSLYPIEFEDQDIEQIANKLLTPFGLQAVFDADKGNQFKKVAPEPDQGIYDFLSGLAKQRGLVITNTPQGNLLFWKATSDPSIANIKEGERPFVSCSPTFNQQNYFSHITGILPVKNKKDSERYTWENNFLKMKGILRPTTFILDDSESGDLKSAVEIKAGRMFGNACTYSLTLQGHHDQSGNLWNKNTIINVQAKGAMIYNETDFLIKDLTLSRTNSGGDTTTMNLVLPGSYSGKIPQEVPWELSENSSQQSPTILSLTR